MRKAFLILLVLAGGLGAWAFLSRTADETGEAARYRTDNISRGPIIATVSATGTVLATTTVIVGSQLSGQVVEILADHNDEVKAGQELAVVEAMKMENILRADADAVVAKVHAAAGDSLAVDQPIVEFA